MLVKHNQGMNIVNKGGVRVKKKEGDGMQQKGPGDNIPSGPPHNNLVEQASHNFISLILRARNANRDDDSHNTPASPTTPRGGGTNSSSPAY